MKSETFELPLKSLYELELRAVCGEMIDEILAEYAPQVPPGIIPTSIALEPANPTSQPSSCGLPIGNTSGLAGGLISKVLRARSLRGTLPEGRVPLTSDKIFGDRLNIFHRKT